MICYKTSNIDKSWDENLVKFENWNIFQTSTWINVYKRVLFPKAEQKGYLFYDKDELICMMPVLIIKKAVICIGGAPIRHLLTPYMGPAYNEKIEDCISIIYNLVKESGLNIFRFTLFENDSEILFGNKGYQISKYSTSKIELFTGIDKLWMKMNGKTRNQIKKGEKNALNISEIYDDNMKVDYLNLRKEMYSKQKIAYDTSNKFINEIFNALDNKNIKMFAIYYDNIMISGVLLLLYNEICYYWDGASASKYNNLCANNLLQWHSIRWACEKGLKYYDMGGTNTPSIAHFKKGFGGKEVNYYRIGIFQPKILGVIWNELSKINNMRNPRLKE